MALNDVILVGRIYERPQFYYRKGDASPYKCILRIETIVRYANSMNRDNIVTDVVPLRTESTEMIQKINDTALEMNDIVIIKGVISTGDIMRKIICCDCGEEFTDLGVVCFVHPTFFKRLYTNLTEADSRRELMEFSEMSNDVKASGKVCSDVTYSEEYHNASYKLSVKRSYRIKEDPPEKKRDYPAVITYSKQADEDSKRVHIGTKMVVKGSLRVREIEKHVHCPECSALNVLNYAVSELAASNIEYTANWTRDEEQPTAEFAFELNGEETSINNEDNLWGDDDE